MGAFENLMQAGENEQRHEGPFDICCWWDRTTPHCVVNVVMWLSRPAALGEGGKWRNMRTGTPLQPDKCFICSLCYEHTHMHLTRLGCSLTHRHCLSLRSSFAEQLRASELIHGAQHLPIYSDTKTRMGNGKITGAIFHIMTVEEWVIVPDHVLHMKSHYLPLLQIFCVFWRIPSYQLPLHGQICAAWPHRLPVTCMFHRHVPPRFDSACLCTFQCVHHPLLSVCCLSQPAVPLMTD